MQYAGNVHSQNGEDNIITELLRRLEGHCDGHCCEFGAWDGKHLSNTFLLVETRGYSAVYIEADPDRFATLLQTAREHPSITPLSAMVTADNIDALLGGTNIPVHFDLLSIDVDGPDYQIWQGLTRYRPKLVVIEIESSVRPGTEMVHGDSDASPPGTSFTSMLRLARSKQYTFFCHTGNMIFVANEYRHLMDCPENPEDHFTATWAS